MEQAHEADEIDLARVICALQELDDPGARGFTLGEGEWPLRGFVVRRARESDARQVELTLTPRGAKAIAGVGATAQERLAEGLATLPVDERTTFAGTIERWIAAAGIADVPATLFFEDRGTATAPRHRKSGQRRQ